MFTCTVTEVIHWFSPEGFWDIYTCSTGQEILERNAGSAEGEGQRIQTPVSNLLPFSLAVRNQNFFQNHRCVFRLRSRKPDDDTYLPATFPSVPDLSEASTPSATSSLHDENLEEVCISCEMCHSSSQVLRSWQSCEFDARHVISHDQ